MNARTEQPEVGLTVVHRRYVSYSHAHYAGNLVDGAWGLGLFGDVATEMCIRTDGVEGLFAAYADVQFLAPVRAGDLVEASATLVRVGSRSRELDFALVVVARGDSTDHGCGRDAARADRGHHCDRHRRGATNAIGPRSTCSSPYRSGPLRRVRRDTPSKVKFGHPLFTSIGNRDDLRIRSDNAAESGVDSGRPSG